MWLCAHFLFMLYTLVACNVIYTLSRQAIGFYTELDFWNEAQNQMRLRTLLREKNIAGVTVPKVYPELCTRRLLVSEWMEGTKLSDCSRQDINAVTPYAQEAFLTQLFELGFFHAGTFVYDMYNDDDDDDVVDIQEYFR